MKPRGFALLAVLWVVAVVGAAVGATAGALRTSERAAANRVALIRGRWAAEACAAIAEARVETPSFMRGDTVELGRGVRCAWRVRDPGTGLDVNTAPSSGLARLFAALGASPDTAEAWARRLVSGRGAGFYGDVEHAVTVASLPPGVAPYLSVLGDGSVSADAPPAVLATLDGITPEAVALLARRRAESRPVANLDELAGLLSPSSRLEMVRRYASLQGRLRFAPRLLLLVSDGWVGIEALPPVATLELVVVRQGAGLAVLQRRMR